MAAGKVQHAASATDTISPGTSRNALFAAPTTGGNDIIACVAVSVASGTPTITVSDDTNGAYTLVVERFDATELHYAGIFRKKNATSIADSKVWASNAGATATGVIVAAEVSGLDPTTAAQTGTHTTSSGSTSHVASTTPLSATGFGVGCAQTGLNGAKTVSGSWAQFASPASDTLSRFFMWAIATFSSDQGSYTTAASDIDTSALALFAEATVTPPPTTLTWLPRQQILRGPRGLMTPSGPVPPTRPEP